MARKKTSGSEIVLVGIFILIAMITKYWQLVVAIGSVTLIIWFIAKLIKNSATNESENSATPETQTQVNAKPSPSVVTLNSTIPENTGRYIIPSLSYPDSSISQSSSDDSYGVGSPQQQSVSADSVWVPQGRTVEKDGHSISGGLIYIGRGLKTVGWRMGNGTSSD